MRITIDIEAPAWLRPISKIALPALAILAAGTVVANPSPPAFVPWGSGAQLTSAALNKAFSDINTYETQARVVTNGTAQYSVGATKYCGLTTPSTAGDLSGFPSGGANPYARAKAACEQAPGCISATAHVCTAEEISRSVSLGIPSTGLPSGYYQSGMASSAPNGPEVNDCSGWTSKDPTGALGLWWDGAGFPHLSPCNNADHFLCCD